MKNEFREHRELLLFGTPPGDFARMSEAIRQALADEYAAASSERQAQIVEVVGNLAIDLRSYLARWHLLAPQRACTLD